MGLPVLERAAEARGLGPEASSPVVIEWIRDGRDIEALRDEWRELEAAVQRRTVLSTFDYNATWYRCYSGPDADTLIGIARRGSTLVGVAPLVMRRRRVG